MDDIRRLLKLASSRLEMTSFLSHLHIVATIIIGAVLIPLLLIDKAPAEEFLPWTWIAWAAGGRTGRLRGDA